MGQLVFQATLGGQVNLVGPNTASTYNINVPAVAGNMVTTGDTGTVTSTMLASSLSLTTPNINVATGTSLKVTSGFYSTSSSSFTYTDGIVMDYTTGLGRISVGTSDGLAFYNGGVATTELMRIDSSGNVGIGTSSNTAGNRLFSVGGGIQLSGGTSAQAGLRIQYASSVATITGINNDNNTYNPISFYTGASEAMRIDTSGNLLVGTTSRVNSASKQANWVVASGIALETNSTTTANYYPSIFYNNGATAGYISVSGTTTAFVSISDYRLKEDAKPMVGALKKVIQLNPCTYKWKSDGSEGQGFIAHELQAVVPDCVVGEKDAVDADGNPVYQGIDTSFLVATLTAAIQELKADLDATKAELAALKAPQ